MSKFVIIGGGLCALLLIAGCTVKTPQVTFTSERTALEKQILGEYRTIEEDALMITSMRSSDSAAVVIPPSKRAVLEAFAERRFNADDIEDFKKDGVVGENTEGLLTILPTDKYRDDPEYRRLVDRIVAEENRDREIIMDRIVEVSSSVNPFDRDAVRKVFARMNREASPPGTFIQTPEGRWVRK